MAEPHESRPTHADPHAQGGWSIETIQSLIVAFVLAMAFRSFVLEGFEIPTGSMAPTLMGSHLRLRSPQTGYEYPADAQPALSMAMRAGQNARQVRVPIRDPMLGPLLDVQTRPVLDLVADTRLGDRVLVHKALYPFLAPRRWDVVVFKNPTDPVGDTQNYIKRLVGLPDEQLLLLDGDVFAGPLDAGLEAMRIQRKPDHVQRAVWQPVHDIDWTPIDVRELEQVSRRPWLGMPWSARGWDETDPRALRCDGSAEATLRWEQGRRQVDDWTAYNTLRDVEMRGEFVRPYPVSDIRVAFTIVADAPGSMSIAMELATRGHDYRFELGGGVARVSMTREGADGPSQERSAPFDPGRAGRPLDVEFVQLDQSLAIFVDGRALFEPLEYEWTVAERIRHAYSGLSLEDYARNPAARLPTSPQLRLSVSGSAATLRRLRVDRDLYYRPGELSEREQYASNGPPIRGLAFATDPEQPARLDAEHYLMLGDNSSASRDGRAWGRPHPIVSAQIGDSAPFLVHRRLLLGRAVAVYFPAPLPWREGGRRLVPNFGRLRFIR